MCAKTCTMDEKWSAVPGMEGGCTLPGIRLRCWQLVAPTPSALSDPLAIASDYSVEQAVVQPRSSGLSWGSEPPAFHQALDETEAFDATVRRRIEIRIR